MSKSVRRVAFSVALALLAITSAGFVRAASAAYGDVASDRFEPSAIPALLGPIDELGRNGWRCLPERAAESHAARAAELPAGDEQ